MVAHEFLVLLPAFSRQFPKSRRAEAHWGTLKRAP
jgi:hypothetical protein